MWRRTGLISFWEKFKSMSLPTNWMNCTFYNWHNEECWWLWWLILCTQLVRLWYPALLTTPKPLTVWIKTNCGKFFKRWEYQTTWPASWEICMHVKKQQLEPDWNNRLFPNWERSMSRLYFVTLQNARLEEAQTGIKIIGRNINDLRYADDTTLMAESKEELKSLLIKMKDSTFKKLRSRHPVPSLHGK